MLLSEHTVQFPQRTDTNRPFKSYHNTAANFMQHPAMSMGPSSAFYGSAFAAQNYGSMFGSASGFSNSLPTTAPASAASDTPASAFFGLPGYRVPLSAVGSLDYQHSLYANALPRALPATGSTTPNHTQPPSTCSSPPNTNARLADKLLNPPLASPAQLDTKTENDDCEPSDLSSTNSPRHSTSASSPDSQRTKGSTKKRPNPVPEEKKDTGYWEKRRKNNESAKRSRDTRRIKEEQIALRVVYLEQENLQLRTEVGLLRSEIEKLRCMLYNP